VSSVAALRAPNENREEIDANENYEEGQRGKCPPEAATAIRGAGGSDRLAPLAPGAGGEQDLGLHPHAQPQKPENRREILADDKLRKVFGKGKVTMFEMNKYLAQHLR
jgi:SWIB/MDM2 domain